MEENKEIYGKYIIHYFNNTTKKFKIKNLRQYATFMQYLRVAAPIKEIIFYPVDSIISV